MKTFALWVCSMCALGVAAPLIDRASTSGGALFGGVVAMCGVAGVMAALVRMQR